MTKFARARLRSARSLATAGLAAGVLVFHPLVAQAVTIQQVNPPPGNPAAVIEGGQAQLLFSVVNNNPGPGTLNGLTFSFGTFLGVDLNDRVTGVGQIPQPGIANDFKVPLVLAAGANASLLLGATTADNSGINNFDHGDWQIPVGVSLNFGGIDQIASLNATVRVNDPAPVPEPSTLLLFGSSLAGLGGLAWRRHRHT